MKCTVKQKYSFGSEVVYICKIKKILLLGEYISLSKMLSSPKLRRHSSLHSDFQHTCHGLVMPNNMYLRSVVTEGAEKTGNGVYDFHAMQSSIFLLLSIMFMSFAIPELCPHTLHPHPHFTTQKQYCTLNNPFSLLNSYFT